MLALLSGPSWNWPPSAGNHQTAATRSAGIAWPARHALPSHSRSFACQGGLPRNRSREVGRSRQTYPPPDPSRAEHRVYDRYRHQLARNPRKTTHVEDMLAAIRTARTTWTGDLASGSGILNSGTSGAFSDLPVSWAARTESAGGKTSPEELLAAAHSSCFAMALSAALGRAGTPPQKLDVTSEVTFDRVDGGFKVVSSKLTVRGVVPGMSADDFKKAAEGAKDGCPISGAIKGNVQLSVDAALES